MKVKIYLTHQEGSGMIDLRGLRSLRQIMDEYRLGDFAAMFVGAVRAQSELSTGDSLKQCMPPAIIPSIREVCTDEFLRNLSLVLDGLLITCRNFEAEQSLILQMENLKRDLVEPTTDKREGILATRLRTILDGIEAHLESRKFMFVPPDQAEYHHYPLMFGPSFLMAFSRSTKQPIFEMREAGRCYACGLWTACVFHCMRAVEFAMRRLFRIAGAKLPVQGVGNPKKRTRYQIEYADWNTVITQIKNKIAGARNLVKGRRREERLKFLSELADHCEYMKDIWRNEIAHTRRVYRKEEALAVINRVRGFMELVCAPMPR